MSDEELLQFMEEEGDDFHPSDLFGVGDTGFYLAYTDISTLYQDLGASNPVTASGQIINYVVDQSGEGNDFDAPVVGYEPVFQEGGGYSYGDFSATALWANSAIFTTGDYTVVSLIEAAPHFGVLIAQHNNSATIGRTYFLGSDNSAPNNKIRHFHNDGATRIILSTTVALDSTKKIMIVKGDAGSYSVRVDNGADEGTISPGTYTPQSTKTRIGAAFSDTATSIPLSSSWQGKVYSNFGISRPLSDEELSSLNSYLAAKAGKIL